VTGTKRLGGNNSQAMCDEQGFVRTFDLTTLYRATINGRQDTGVATVSIAGPVGEGPPIFSENFGSTSPGIGLHPGGLGAARPQTSQIGGSGDDRLIGRSRNDLIYGGRGNDLIRGARGNDQLYGGPGNDRIYGGPGDDRIYGGPGNDRISGGPGNDRIYGGPGNDRIYGGPGNDRIYGGPGNDRIYGGPGNDRIVDHRGATTVFPGPGTNRVDVADRHGGDRVVCAPRSTNHIVANRSDRISRRCRGKGSISFVPSSLAGETFTSQMVNGSTLTGTCNGNEGGNFSFSVSGMAAGPFPGTFTESGSFTAAPGDGYLNDFSSTFTITSTSVTVTGTKRLLGHDSSQVSCHNGYLTTDKLTTAYTATINGTGGDQGTATVNIAGLVGGRSSPVFSENFGSTGAG
jgi:hypothetical protein